MLIFFVNEIDIMLKYFNTTIKLWISHTDKDSGQGTSRSKNREELIRTGARVECKFISCTKIAIVIMHHY